ncbi:hypothetical protein D9758_001943 [Tetrapyrgos nigripes]|uniref:Uncharacterized protein n=1 Tax=Tetrapyrgos nigripes TaxID=182062 RepID=A0A8H5GTJ7_9AGAR|nr:hypothetical protein D9758_001943 [Tetrapyrgos nigripes]
MGDSNFVPLAIPRFIWTYYVDYLVNYKPNSIVAKIASSFRVLAVLLILPILILGLLDISSYVIARTLGVIDDVKASTSDSQTVHSIADSPPTIRTQKSKLRINSSNSLSPTSESSDSSRLFTLDSGQSSLGATTPDGGSFPPEYFSTDNSSLKLSGVGVFSPASSQPPSPTLSRRTLAMDGRLTITELDGDEGTLRKREKRRGTESIAT